MSHWGVFVLDFLYFKIDCVMWCFFRSRQWIQSRRPSTGGWTIGLSAVCHTAPLKCILALSRARCTPHWNVSRSGIHWTRPATGVMVPFSTLTSRKTGRFICCEPTALSAFAQCPLEVFLEKIEHFLSGDWRHICSHSPGITEEFLHDSDSRHK